MPDFKTKISARCFSGLGALFPFNLPWVEIVGQAARLTCKGHARAMCDFCEACGSAVRALPWGRGRGERGAGTQWERGVVAREVKKKFF